MWYWAREAVAPGHRVFCRPSMAYILVFAAIVFLHDSRDQNDAAVEIEFNKKDHLPKNTKDWIFITVSGRQLMLLRSTSFHSSCVSPNYIYQPIVPIYDELCFKFTDRRWFNFSDSKPRVMMAVVVGHICLSQEFFYSIVDIHPSIFKSYIIMMIIFIYMFWRHWHIHTHIVN